MTYYRNSSTPRKADPPPTVTLTDSPVQISRSSPDERYYNTRYAYHDATPTVQTHKSRSNSRSNIKVKRTWPPAPAVEDEKVALAKELNPPRAWDGDRDETAKRGSVDQEPIILDSDMSWKDLEAQLDESSAIKYHKNKVNATRNLPNLTPLNAGTPINPGLDGRQPSPYVFIPKDPSSSSPPSRPNTQDFSGYPPQNLQSPNRMPAAPNDNIPVPEPLHGNGKVRNRNGVMTSSVNDHGDTMEDQVDVRRPEKVRASSYLASRPDLAIKDRNDADQKDVLEPRTRKLKSEVVKETRRMSDSTLPRPDFNTPAHSNGLGRLKNASSLVSPLSTPVSTPLAKDFVNSSSSRPLSVHSAIPFSLVQGHLPSPPRSPRVTPQQSHSTPASGRSTGLDSRTSSRSSSPASGAAAFRLEETLRRASTLPVAADMRPHHATPLVNKLTPYEGFIAPHILASAANAASSLPYPVTESRLMPLEDHYGTASPTQESGVRVICPRAGGCRNRDDWWVLDGSPYFNICPTCLDSTFTGTSFRKYFFRAPKTDPGRTVKCDFGCPWMRMAWLLTQERSIYNLDLMQAVSYVTSTEQPCSEVVQEQRVWYTFIDKRGHVLEDFYICPCDMRKIEALFPSLRGSLVRCKSSSRRRKCGLRAESTRFHEYLDQLVDIDAYAISRGKRPDLSGLFNLVRHKTQFAECSRDTLLHDEVWHFDPSLPEFTVCEDCYHTVIRPHAKDGAPVALRINKNPAYLNEKSSRRNDTLATSGISCQLYSPRMRAVFEKAVARSDYNYLARWAMDRKEVETELRQQELALRLAEDAVIKAGGLAYAHDREAWRTHPRYAGLVLELEQARHEWKNYE